MGVSLQVWQQTAEGIEIAIDSVDEAALSSIIETEVVDDRAIEADAVLRLAAGLEVGYRGFVLCAAARLYPSSAL